MSSWDGGVHELVASPVKLVPFIGRECAEHESHVYQVELVPPGPILADVVDFEDAVRWYPGGGRWEEIHPVDGDFWGVNKMSVQV